MSQYQEKTGTISFRKNFVCLRELISIRSLLFDRSFSYFFFEKFKLPSNSFFRWVLVFSGLQLLSLPHRISPRPWPSIYISLTKPQFCVSQSQPPICISWFPFGSWSLICFLTMKPFQASFKLFIDSLILDFAFLYYFF